MAEEQGEELKEKMVQRILELQEKTKKKNKKKKSQSSSDHFAMEKKVANTVVDYIMAVNSSSPRVDVVDLDPVALDKWTLDYSLLLDITELQDQQSLGLGSDTLIYAASCCANLVRKSYSSCRHIYLTSPDFRDGKATGRVIDFVCCAPATTFCRVCRKALCILHLWPISPSLLGPAFLQGDTEEWCVDCALRTMKWSEIRLCHEKFGEDKRKAEKYKKQIREKNVSLKVGEIPKIPTEDGTMALILRCFDALKYQRGAIPVFHLLQVKRSFLPHFTIRHRDLSRHPTPYLNRWLLTQLNFVQVPIQEGFSLERHLKQSWICQSNNRGALKKYVTFFYSGILQFQKGINKKYVDEDE